MNITPVLEIVIQWISLNYLEVIGACLGIIYVILATKQNIWCWYAGIINVIIYIFVFIDARLYGDMALQILYLLMSFYGIYKWKFSKTNTDNELKITNIGKKQFLYLLIITIILSVGFGYILTYTNTDVPRWDGITTALGLVGTWMTARKFIENWLVWIIANSLCVALYFYKELYPTVGFYAIITILAIIGYFKWKKQQKAAELSKSL